MSVNDQVRARLGDGLDLRFCITTADYIAHAVEEAQHMDRISIVEGLDNPSNKPHVDILVPDGKVTCSSATPGSGLYDAELKFSTGGPNVATTGLVQKGAAREESLASGGTGLYTAMAGLSHDAVRNFQALARSFASRGGGSTTFAIEDVFATTKAFVDAGTTDGL